MKRILSVLILAASVLSAMAEEHRLTVDPLAKTDAAHGVYRTVNEALREAERYADDPLWTIISIAPGVYWIDDPDDSKVRKPTPGSNTPYGMEVRLSRTRLTGTSGNAEDVVLACNRGQTHGADGNFTMLHITGNDVEAENITFGNYCNVDLVYPRNPQLNRARRATPIVQAQLIICNGDRYRARNCRFISRLNLCPFAGAKHADFEECYFECTDDALCGTGTYRRCRFTFFSSKPFYATSPQGALFDDCNIHSKVYGTQYLTKVSAPVTLRNCRWTSDDKDLKIEWAKKPNPKDVCVMDNCTLNGKPLVVPTTPDIPMPVTTPMLALMPMQKTAPGQWTLDAYKPKDTQAYVWNIEAGRPSWCFGEGVDGAEGCYGLIQNVKGARLMYTGLNGVVYKNQTLEMELAPCKSAGQGFGSATGQYLDLCIKFDTRTLTGYGLRFVRTPEHDHAVDVYLVEYTNGNVSALSKAAKCTLFKRGCRVRLSAKDNELVALISNGNLSQTMSVKMSEENTFGGIHIQHTGSVGASATVIQSINCSYE